MSSQRSAKSTAKRRHGAKNSLVIQGYIFSSTIPEKNDNGEWQLIDPVTAYANESKVAEMLDDLLNKRIKRTMEVTNLNQFALDVPNIQIDLWTDGGTIGKSFLIGSKTVNYSVYAKEASESHIFLIESSALQDLTKSPMTSGRETR